MRVDDLMPKQGADLDPLLADAKLCIELGYFEGALIRARRFASRGSRARDASIHLTWLVRLYCGDFKTPSPRQTRRVLPILGAVSDSYGVAELALVDAHAGHMDSAARGIRLTLEAAKRARGCTIPGHPTIVIRLADFALLKLGDTHSARQLVNLALTICGFLRNYSSASKHPRHYGLTGPPCSCST